MKEAHYDELKLPKFIAESVGKYAKNYTKFKFLVNKLVASLMLSFYML